MEKSFLLVVPFYPTGGGVAETTKAATGLFSSMLGGKKSTPPGGAAKQNDEEAEIVFKENSEQLSQRTNQVISGLTSIGLDASILENQELVELFYNFYNPQTVERGTIAPQDKSQEHAS